MGADKHLVLDVSILLDLWLNPQAGQSTLEIFDQASACGAKLWMSAASLPTLEFVAIQRFKASGVLSAQARTLVKRLMRDLLGRVDILSNPGYEQAELYNQARDYEDAQIAVSATCLQGADVCFVSLDRTVDAQEMFPVLSPQQALEWLQTKPDGTENALNFIDLAAQQRAIRPKLERHLNRVLNHGQYILGPEVTELENKLAAYTGTRHCITVASGTEALLISLMALDIGAGDEIITTPFSFVATVEVIVRLGARPVFVDIEPDTCNIDARLIEAKITDKTRAILSVSLYGQPADMDAINAIAAKYDIPVIEDGAQSFGADYKGRKSGNLSTLGCTSFFPSKPLGCYGDGGAIFTADDNLAQACREIRVHGQSQRYLHTRIGVGGRMDTLQCAVVLAKLERFDEEIEQRRAIGERYNAFMDRIGIQRIRQRPERRSVYAQYTVFVTQRESVQDALRKAGIPTAVHYPMALNQQPAYRHLCCPDCTPVAHTVATQVLSVPMGADLRPPDQDAILHALQSTVVLKYG